MRYGNAEGAVVEVVTASGRSYIGKLHWLDSNEVAIIRQKLLVSFHKNGQICEYQKISDNCENITVDEPEIRWIHINPELVESWRYVTFLDVANNAALKTPKEKNGIRYYYDSNYAELLISPTQTVGATRYDESIGGYCVGNESVDFVTDEEISEEEDKEIMKGYLAEVYQKEAEDEELVHEESADEAEEKVASMVYDVLQRNS